MTEHTYIKNVFISFQQPNRTLDYYQSYRICPNLISVFKGRWWIWKADCFVIALFIAPELQNLKKQKQKPKQKKPPHKTACTTHTQIICIWQPLTFKWIVALPAASFCSFLSATQLYYEAHQYKAIKVKNKSKEEKTGGNKREKYFK